VVKAFLKYRLEKQTKKELEYELEKELKKKQCLGKSRAKTLK